MRGLRGVVASVFAAPDRALVAVLGLIISFAAFYSSGVGVFDETISRVGTLGVAMALGLLAFPLPGRIGRAVDILLLILGVVIFWRYFQIGEALEEGLYDFTTSDLWLGGMALLLLLDLTRRIFGWPLVIVCGLTLVYGLYGHHLPWIFRHAGFPYYETLRTVWYSFDGVFGGPVAVVTSLILIFVVFGVVLEGIGAGPVLLKMAFSVTAKLRGGPAHAAIVASALFGTMSGSVAGNVVGTGVFTMPMIKKRGFSAKFAGAVEAAASSGGQFTPPVMGAVAFIMADVTGIPYLTICIAAAIPALFYYASLFASVAVNASRLGIQPIPDSERQAMTRQDWVLSLTFVLPLLVIIGLLIAGRSPAVAGFWATIAAAVLGFILNPDLRREPQRLLAALAQAGRAGATILVAVGAVGMIIGVMNMTGLGIRFANVILGLSGQSLFLALLLTMAGCLVLGMGMPTVPAYLIIVLTMGPAIQGLGVPTLVAHLFVVYFGVLSSITPPVALAAFAAAPICGASPMATAVESVKVAIIGFIIPFVFVYNPSLTLMVDFEWGEFLWACLRLVLAIWVLASGLGGYDRARLDLPSRAVRIVSGVAMLMPGGLIEFAAFAAALVMLGFDWRRGLAASPPGFAALAARFGWKQA
ncbi:TRAP transporter permease [Ferrovibrio xuzhouensis]|uniref:TRAP transporter permease n=1 Tax=Ferrovibrio xuzhouensis TaxID=1576914 RepID=A0ABV7VHS5_9PROT